MRKSLESPEEMMMDAPGDMLTMFLPRWGTPQWPYKNPETGEFTVVSAMKCPECGEIFHRFDEEGMPTDKCAKCGYSKREERNKRKKDSKKQKQLERKKKRSEKKNR